MPRGLDLVVQINTAAQVSGAVGFVAQLENLATHAQYCVPYALTAQAIKPGDRVLDWGCGNGHFSLLLEVLGAQITGYSFEPPPRCMAKSPCFQFVAGSEADPRTLPFADASFDAAVGVGVLEHVWETGGDERASLAELARVVRSGGALLTFHLPNRTGWIEKVVHGLRLNKHFHKRKFDEVEIRALLKEAGFAVQHVGLYNTLPRAELKLLPGFLKHRRWFATLYGLIDDAIAVVIPRVCTNFYIVARRVEAAPGQ